MWGTAVAAMLAIALVGRGVPFPPAGVLLLIIALAAALEHAHFALPSAGYQTFGAGVSLPAIALFGPVPTAVASALGVFIGDGMLRRRQIPTILFNVGQRILSILLAGLAWNTLLGGHPTFGHVSLPGHAHHAFAAVLALMMIYAVATTVQVAVFLSASRVEPFWRVLASGALWRLPTVVILGTFGLSLSVMFIGLPVQTGAELGNLLTVILTVSLVALLYISRRQQLNDLANLHRAIAEMLQRLELSEVLNLLADQVTRIAKPDMLWIALRQDNGALDVALARTPGIDPELLKSPQDERGHGVLGWVLANRRSQRIADYLRDPRRTVESDEIFGRHRVRAVLMIPMLAGDEAVGVITLTNSIPGYFTEHQEQVIKTLTAQAAIVVRNAQLYDTSQRNVARFEALKAISDRINSQQDIGSVIDLIAESARQILRADRIALYLGEVGKEITHTFSRNLPQEHLQASAERLRLGTGFASLAMRSKEPMVASDALVDGRTNHELALEGGYRTVAAFPLSYRDAIIGVLILYHNVIRPYTSSDVALGMAFASQVAIAVQNTRLRQEAEDKAHQLALLNRTFTRVATSLGPRELFDVLVDELHTTLNYPLAMLRLVDGDQLRHVAHRGYAGVKESSPLTAGIVGRVARTGQGALVADVSRDPDYIAWDPRVTQEACVPIMSQARVVGIINVELIEPRLTQGDFDLLMTLAGYAAVALEKARLYEQTQELASTDGLTGLLNYRAFWLALERELERSMRYGLPLSLIMIEIDKFKRYNDTYGHLRGDEVIRLVARVLTQEHRAQIDTIARYGGDEFMILLPHTQKVTAAEIAERVRRAVEATPLISEASVASVTLSLGVASYPEDGKSTDTLVEAADRSMYRAKERGGNAVALANLS